jgi:hypothetical protein
VLNTTSQDNAISTLPNVSTYFHIEGGAWDGAVELITAQFPLTDVDSGTLARTGHGNNNERTGLFIVLVAAEGAEAREEWRVRHL